MDFLTLGVMAGFLATLNMKLVEAFVTPLFDHFKLDKFYIQYIALLSGAVLTIAAQINLLENVIVNPGVGVFVSGLIIGGGSSLLHDVLDKPQAKPAA